MLLTVNEIVVSKVTEVMARNDLKEESCPIVEAIREIGGEWRLIIIRYLADNPQGFNELMKRIPGINSKTLSSTLKYLEEHLIVERNVESTRPFRVRYKLTQKGISLGVALSDLKKWGQEWLMEAKDQGQIVREE